MILPRRDAKPRFMAIAKVFAFLSLLLTLVDSAIVLLYLSLKVDFELGDGY